MVPETHVGGKLYELYKQYNEELYMDRIRPAAVVTGHADLIDVQFEASDLVPEAEGINLFCCSIVLDNFVLRLNVGVELV